MNTTTKPEESPARTLRRYRRAIAGLPLPTPAQCAAFARHLVQDHSWYKGLPLSPPGLRFYIYLSPLAGWSIYRDCIKGGHYARPCDADNRLGQQLLTTEYRERFGYLDYGHEGADAPYLLAGNPLTRWIIERLGRHLPVRPAALPDALLAVASTPLTAFIDTRVVRDNGIFTVLDTELAEQLTAWPEESGGSAMRQRILERSRQASQKRWHEKSFAKRHRFDPDGTPSTTATGNVNREELVRRYPLAEDHDFDLELYALTAPEQARQFAALQQAIAGAVRWAEANGARRP